MSGLTRRKSDVRTFPANAKLMLVVRHRHQERVEKAIERFPKNRQLRAVLHAMKSGLEFCTGEEELDRYLTNLEGQP